MEYCPEADKTATHQHMIFRFVMYVSNVKINPGILNIPSTWVEGT